MKKIEPTKPPQKRHWQVAFEPTKNNPKSPFQNSLNSESYSRYSCESCLCSIEHNFQKTGDSTPRTALKWAVHSHSTHISTLPVRTKTTRNVPLSAAELEKRVKVFGGGIVTSAFKFSLSEGKRDLSRLTMNQLRRENTAGVAVRLLRMKRRECLAGRAQAGGHDGPSIVANAQELLRACWHFPPRQGRSLKGRPKHAS